MSQTTLQDVIDHKHNGSWRTLERLALMMIEDAERHAGAVFAPHLGGGTQLKYAEGEIDFIVGMSLLGLPAERSDDTPLLLEPVAE
jgi:hypothetical protein